MAGNPIARYVERQILAQGGWPRILERIRRGETVTLVARTMFRPDGQPIDRTTLSHMLHADAERTAQVREAMRGWHDRPKAERTRIRNRLRASLPQRAMQAFLRRDERKVAPAPPVSIPPIVLRQMGTERPVPRNGNTPRRAPTTAPRPALPAPETPSADPEPPRKPTGVLWDEFMPWCFDCQAHECKHTKREYCVRVERRRREQENRPVRTFRFW